MAQTKDGAVKVAAKRLGITPEEYRARADAGLKWCTGCKEWQQVEDFNKDASRHDGLKASCWRYNHTIANKRPGQRKRREMKERGLSWCRGCDDWLPEDKVAQGACRKHLSEEERNRYARNKEFRHKRRQRVHARKRNVDPMPIEGAEYRTDSFDGACVYCGKNADTWDHVVPVSRGGNTTPDNIVPACVSCNASKGNRDVWEWIADTHRSLSSQAAEFLLWVTEERGE